MEFSILGPLEVAERDRLVALGGGKPRALLALLLLHPNEVVPSERLIEELWGASPPATAAKGVQLYVSQLRKALRTGGIENTADGPLLTRAGGYVLRLDDGQLDVQRFERLLDDGRRSLEAGRPEQAAQTLREALALWRGPPLVDFSYEVFAQREIARLEELRIEALEERIEADLALGRHAELVPELETLVAEHPLRERVRGQLILALYRSDRQVEALDVFRHGRRRLVEELGLEPSPALQGLEQAILTHSAGLAAPATPGAPGERGLPVPPNRTIAREQELAVLGERLRTPSVRLLTLTGPGGVGKTRLAVEAGRAVQSDFADGARFVALGAVSRPEDVPSAIVQALAIVSVSGETGEQSVIRFLGAKELLLVLDNFEHVLPAARVVSELLVACSGVTVLATSREPLALHAEQRYPVAPLALPQPGTSEDPTSLTGVEAVALFVERARAHDPGFDVSAANATAVAEICRRVDGLPLAIELAAARCGLLSPREIAQRLDAVVEALGVGARDAPARQQTLRATIDWSHDLLSEPAKTCFARFAVFAGGATVRAAEAITGADLDTLDDLVAKNLLVRHEHPDEETRLGMLETIRAYAVERFASAADREAVRERHFEHFLALAQRHATEQALWSAERNEHLAKLDAESDNLHAALAWAVSEGNAGRALSMAGAVSEYWRMRSRFADAVNWIDQVLNQPGADAYPALRVRLLTVKAMALWDLGRAAEQPPVWAQAEAVARALGDPVVLSRALEPRVSGESLADRVDVAEALADEALRSAQTAGDEWTIAMAAFGKMMAAATIADLRERTDHAASLLEEVGNLFFLANLLASAAYGAMSLGGDLDAKELVGRAVPIARRLDDPSLWMMVHGNVGLAALLTGDIEPACDAFREELRLCRELVVRPFAFEGLSGLAAVAATRGETDRAARLAGAASALHYGAPYAVVEDRFDATFFEAARASCGTDAWNAAAGEGAALSFDDAIAYALQEPRA